MLVLAGWGLVFAPTVCRAEILTGCCEDVVTPAVAVAPECACPEAGHDHEGAPSPLQDTHEDEPCYGGCCADVRCDDSAPRWQADLTPAALPAPALSAARTDAPALRRDAGACPMPAAALPYPPSDRPLLI